MMRPTAADNLALPFLFYREYPAGSGALTLDPRVIVERVTEGVRGDGSADLLLRWEGDQLDDGTWAQLELTDLVINERYGPTVRCAVAIAPPPGGGNVDLVWLAHGYIDVPQLKFSADATQAFMRRPMKLRDILRRTARRNGSHVQGRWMLSQAGWQHAQDNPAEDPIDLVWATLGAHVQALPCIFNPNGKPNRFDRPVLFDAPDAWTNGPVHLFTYEGDPDAKHWTLLQALRYLVLMYLPYGTDEQVGPGDLFTTTLSGPVGSEWWKLDESDVALAGAFPSGWMEFMTRRCASLAIEGMDFLEALIALTSQAGVDFAVAHSNPSTGSEVKVLTDLAFAAPGDLASDVLMLERDGSHFDVGGSLRPVDEITQANNVSNGQSARELGNAVSRVEVVGDREWRTVVAELKPLWQPDDDWDIAPPIDPQVLRDAAYDAANPYTSLKDGDFYKRFNPRGEEFQDGENAIIGRLWGVDPAGEFDAATYDRTVPPFDDYGTPWDIPGEAGEVRRRRAIRGIPTLDGYPPMGIVLEINFDYGAEPAAWFRLRDRAQTQPGFSAVYLKVADLLAVGAEILRAAVDAGSPYAVDNFYDAYLQGYLGLRAIFQVELDRRVHQIATTTDSPVASQNLTALVIRDRDFKHDAGDPAVPQDVFDRIDGNNDNAAALRFAEGVLADRAGAKWSGRVAIPWVETARYPLFTPIEGIRRDSAPFTAVEIPFGGNAARDDLFPTVIQRIWTQGDQGVATQLVLQDHRLAKHLGPPD